MGWSFCYSQTIPQLVRERLRSPKQWTGENGKTVIDTVVAHSKRGNNLWYVVERTVILDACSKKIERFLALDLLAYDKKNGAGYKDLEESMGPCQKNCPLYLLDLVPEPERNYGWRDGVRAWHKASSALRRKMKELNPKQGEKWRLREGLVGLDKKTPIHTARILSTAPYIRVEANDGNVYRLKKSHLGYPMGEKEVATLGEMGLGDVIAAVNGLV